jgi:2-polyprenyl-3-methyl-5-hydroxy-6-metoxy-1,4-benzoquinol methylase
LVGDEYVGEDEMTNEPDHSAVGLRDAVLSGWFVPQTNQMFEGLPVTKDDVVLDVGCGNGGIAGFCASQGAAIIVTDTDPEKVAAVERSLAGSSARSVQAIVSDSNPLPLSDGSASIVVSTEVLEHVDDTRRFLLELVRVGKPGARYFLTVPDPVCETLQKSLAPQSYFERPNHVRVIQRDEFATMVEAAGLIVEKRASYGFYWSLWWLMFWACDVDLTKARHPILDNWTRTWAAVMDTPRGLQVKKVLDEFMPKSQVIIARKP